MLSFIHYNIASKRQKGVPAPNVPFSPNRTVPGKGEEIQYKLAQPSHCQGGLNKRLLPLYGPMNWEDREGDGLGEERCSN